MCVIMTLFGRKVHFVPVNLEKRKGLSPFDRSSRLPHLSKAQETPLEVTHAAFEKRGRCISTYILGPPEGNLKPRALKQLNYDGSGVTSLPLNVCLWEASDGFHGVS